MNISTFADAISYLNTYIKPTVFKKITVDATESFDPLDRMQTLLSYLDNPQNKFRSVVVSGTSGKGSTAYLLSHVLTEAGYTTGFTLSPHLETITERLQINEKCIDKASFISLVNKIIPHIEKMKQDGVEPSYFEILLTLAFLYFAEEKVDIAIVEVGIEGKYDATSTLIPEVFVLTNITLDHTQILGESVEEITQEATGVFSFWKDMPKKRKPTLVTAVTQPIVITLVANAAQKAGLRTLRLGQDFSIPSQEESANGNTFRFISESKLYDILFLSLIGRYQVINAALCLETLNVLSEKGLPVLLGHIERAFSSAFFPGRFERLSKKSNGKEVEIILDGAHNPAKMEAFIASLIERYPERHMLFLIGFRKNKDIKEMLKIMQKSADEIIVTKFAAKTETDVFAGAEPNAIGEDLKKMEFTKNISITRTVKEGLNELLEQGSKYEDALCVITGSLYLVGEARMLLNKSEEKTLSEL